MAANLIDQQTLKNVVTGLLNGEFIELGAGFEITLECEREKIGDEIELSHHFRIYDGAKMSPDLLYVDPGYTEDDAIWTKEDKRRFPVSENVFVTRRQMVLEALTEIVFKVVPDLFAKRILEIHDRASDVSNQKERWLEVANSLVGDGDAWMKCSKKDYEEVYGEES